jgi:hypothetical protein
VVSVPFLTCEAVPSMSYVYIECVEVNFLPYPQKWRLKNQDDVVICESPNGQDIIGTYENVMKSPAARRHMTRSV